jgi:hypothetical protein
MEQVAGTTVIRGKVIDQAQLRGFIQRVEDLGLELLAVERAREPSSTGTSERGQSDR